MLLLFTIAHPLVDACSLSVLIAGGMSWQRVIAYNAMAFALQLPMGLLADERPEWVRGGFCFGTGMPVAAAVSVAFGAGGWCPLAMACVGNALFHLTAGKEILDSHGGRGGPIGLFISTGALGLLAGRVGMEHCAAAALPAFAASLAAVAVASAVRWRRTAHELLPPALRTTPLSERGCPWRQGGVFRVWSWGNSCFSASSSLWHGGAGRDWPPAGFRQGRGWHCFSPARP